MYRFWQSVISEIFSILQPRNIVEIGSDHGHHTKKILEYCKKNHALLHVIDPSPQYDETEWQKKYGESLIFHKSLSLSMLPKIDKMDAVLIDGDHNWYTVFNELKLIEKNAKKHKTHFPIVFLHDIAWPYGRRDLYYNPENIPESYRQPYKKKGLMPGKPDLVDEGGLNPHLFNAIYENNSQNGVLTAVEDFIGDTSESIELLKIPALYGLAILYPKNITEKIPELRQFLNDLTVSDSLCSLIDALETEKIASEISRQAQKNQNKILHKKLSETEQQRLASDEATGQLKTILDKQQSTLAEQDRTMHELESKLSNNEQRLHKHKKAFDKSLSDSYKLERWLEQINHDYVAIMDSWRWKVGDKTIRSVEKIMGRPKVKLAVDHVSEMLYKFDKWNKGRKKLEFNSSSDQRHELAHGSPPSNTTVLIKKEKTSQEYFDISTFNVDIVVCVHNALNDVKNCLKSFIEKTNGKYTLYIVNDGSDSQTSDFLNAFAMQHKQCKMLHSAVAEGYTKAANKGLRASAGDYVILLNSDTIVPQNWLERIIECGESNPKIGVIGPLSNAASWQSVPERFDQENGDWFINQLPDNFTVNDLDKVIYRLSDKKFPSVSFLNGFCYAIKRKVIAKIGYLDDVAFPKGYGEENDYSLRAKDAGFDLVIADHLYVYHAKSKSYSHQRRKELGKKGNIALAKKHSKQKINTALDELRNQLVLIEIRENLKEYLALSKNTRLLGNLKANFSVLFILYGSGGGGGSHSVIQEAGGLNSLGITTLVCVPNRYKEIYLNNYKGEKKSLFYFFNSEKELINQAVKFDVVVGTIFTSIKALKKIAEKNKKILPVYYIQDYEPWFSEKESDYEKEALASYTLFPKLVRMAKTDFLCETVKTLHGVKVNKIRPSLDTNIYYIGNTSEKNQNEIHIAAMVRPSTPRRAPEMTMNVLKQLKKKYNNRIKINIFGCNSSDPAFLSMPIDFEFKNYGLISREEVANILRESDIFLDASTYQAFGRTGLEAMACGCIPVLPDKGGTSEYAIHEKNSIVVNTEEKDRIINAIETLIENKELRERLIQQGIKTSSYYSIKKAALSELKLLISKIND